MRKTKGDNNMDMNEYQKLAMRTRIEGQMDEEALLNGTLGLAGESGEVCDYMKKVFFQDHPLDVEIIKEEIGDILWYIALVCTSLQCDMAEIAEMNINKLKLRYPEGFDREISISRYK